MESWIRAWWGVCTVAVQACSGEVPVGEEVAQERVWVDSALEPDDGCSYDASESGRVLARGTYDIARGADPEGAGGIAPCEQPYLAFVSVRSQVADTLLMRTAEVTLLSAKREAIGLGDSATPLPNPFEVNVGGSVEPGEDTTARAAIAVELIPIDYAPWLADRVGEAILVEVSLRGETLGGRPFEARPFIQNVFLCNGCLTACGSPPDNLDEDACDDNAGADGRICFDPSCVL